MADTGLVIVGTGTGVFGSGDNWIDESNVTTESGYTRCRLSKDGGLSDYLRGTNLGFSVPSGATIDGIEVQIRHATQNDEGFITDEYVYLVENGNILPGCQNKALSTGWADPQENFTYGGPTDTWNCSSLTPAVVNSSSFGVQLMAENSASSGQSAYVYWMKIRVYYTEAGGGATYQVVAVGTGLGDANANTKIAICTESGSEGIGSSNVNIKVAKSVNSVAGGYGEAWADTKLAQRVESESAGNVDAFALVNDRTEHRAKGAAKGKSGTVVSVRQLKNIHGFGYGGSSAATKVKGSKHIAGQGVGVSDALVVSLQRKNPFTGLEGVAAVMVDKVLESLSSSEVEVVMDMAPALNALIRAVCEGVAHVFPEPAELASAWVNFRDTGTAIEINASFNISGVTRNGTGDYTVMFASDMPNAEYTLAGIAAAGSSSSPAGNSYILSPRVVSNEFSLKTASAVRVVVCDNNSDNLSARAFSCNLVVYAA